MRKPVALGTGKHLLFDDALTEERRGFRPTMNPAIREPKPVLLPRRPWEAQGISGDSSISVIQEDGLCKLWYTVRFDQPGKANLRELRKRLPASVLAKFDHKTLADFLTRERALLCYATSRDGKIWHKPELGILAYAGSKANNIVDLDRSGGTVFRDPVAAPDERYKVISRGGLRVPHLHATADVPPRNIYQAVHGGYSADGLHWRAYPDPVVPWYTDTTNVCYRDDRLRKYVAFVRWNEGMFYRDGKTFFTEPHGWKYRAIGRTESRNFRRFPPPTKILEPSPRERHPEPTGMDYYNSSAVKYPFAADAYFLFFSSFYHEPDTIDVHLATSRDGIHYTPWREPFLGTGTPGSFDEKRVHMATGMVRAGDELYMYYAGYNSPHGAEAPRRSGAVGRVRLRLDGFVSQDAPWAGGTLTTVPLTFTGDRLHLNMDASAGGSLRVEVLGADRRPVAGWSGREADTLWGNDLAKPVTWGGRCDIASLRGKVVRLRFRGKGVKLYAFQFSDSKRQNSR